jgi:hypothetical protein
VVQIRPLLLSIVEKFPKGEQVKALRLLANCAVRIIVAGVRGGTIERMYNTLAHKVHKGDIDKATKLRDAMKKTVPADQRFIEEFEALRINRAEVARYYLAKLERAKVGDAAAGVTDATPNIGLEHVLPETFDQASWQSFTSTTHREWRNSIGNLCLLNHKPNNALGNRSFAVKAPELGKSIYKLTSEVASAKKWTSKEIEERAVELAKLAPTAWPLDLRMT